MAKAPTKKKAPAAPTKKKAPAAPVVEPVVEEVVVEPVVEEVLVAPTLTEEETGQLKADWEEHQSDPNAEPVVIEAPAVPVELDNVLKVKNQKGKEFEVSKSYYLNNKHKLTLA